MKFIHKYRTRIFPQLAFVILLAAFVNLSAAPAYPPEIPDTTVETYKTVDGIDLRAWIMTPQNHRTEKPVPVIVFFFGGGWVSGTPRQFEQQSKYLAARGMVAIMVDYRVKSRHGVIAKECVTDAKSAIRWVRKNAARLGVDPDRIMAAGGSAGGHLAAACATLPLYDDPDEDADVSSKPNALVLFNPVLVLAPIPEMPEFPAERIARLERRFGGNPESFSPYHNLDSPSPPTLVFHGTADKTVPYSTVVAFHEKMTSLGNRCELVAYKGAGHGFFNYGKRNNSFFIDTVNKMDAFLVSLGYLEGVPEYTYLK
ncbi:alpha/beta hydrolase [Puniceicoccales bacterium CK1056]|uniref:Alpha/beta hydrolase n=2 Tax=Oceanipulchritudo coccoides TaxID=2706888 RepID=A0A6B2M298_9BACT|nr:alpha/beta hydrolase [Oceanipulchritudo coccoides]